jgi:hypothetical protein
MDPNRIVEIYTLLSSIQVHLVEDPRVVGPSYISRAIHQCREAEEQLNALVVEVNKEIARLKQDISLRQFQLKIRRRTRLLSDEIRSQDCSAAERQAMAERDVDKEYEAEVRAYSEQHGQPVPENIPSLEYQLLTIQNTIVELEALQSCIVEKKASINKTDSAVRLQEKALETDARLYSGPNAAITGDRSRRRGNPGGTSPEPSQAWQNLAANGQSVEPVAGQS